MLDHDVVGVQWVTVNYDPDGRVEVDPVFVSSIRAQEPVTHAVLAAAVAPHGKLLLVNDHPARMAPDVVREVDATVDAYRKMQWEVIVDDEAEAEVRKVLPPGHVDEVPPRLHRVLDALGIAGVLRVDAGHGDDPVTITRIDAGGAVVAE